METGTFRYEHRMEKAVKADQIWQCYCDVDSWTRWDPVVASVEFEGPFEVGSKGVKQLRHGQPLPFEIAEMEAGKKLVLTAERGPMKVRQEYEVSEQGMVWRVVIEGGTDNQRNVLGGKMTSHIPEVMGRLNQMVSPEMPNRKEALEMYFQAWQPVLQEEKVPLSEAVGRTLSRDLTSLVTLPMFRVSGMDGIAVNSKNFEHGIPDTTAWKEGEDYQRADTGDDFPDRYDAVIMIEQVDLHEDGSVSLRCPKSVEAGACTRPAGSTIKEGDLLVKAGTVIRPMDLAALAVGNQTEIPVWKKPVVAMIPTGSELIAPGTVPKRGDNIDTNSVMVSAMMKEMGADVVTYPIVRDDRELLTQTLEDALAKADIVVINGGSSKGGEDFNVHLLKEKGTVICHNVSAVPGRPISLALIQNKPVINLPGPTLAAYFAADWCLRAVLNRCLGHEETRPHTVKGTLMEPIDKGAPVEILHRINAVYKEDGTVELYPIPMRGSNTAMLLSSNAQYVTGLFEKAHDKGEVLEVELLR